MGMSNVITVPELQARLAHAPLRLVDVREPNEWQAGHLPGATHMPLGTKAWQILHDAGFTNVRNLQGGIEPWRAAGGREEKP